MDNNQSKRLFFIELYIAFLFFIMITMTCFLSFTKSKLIQTGANNQIQYVNITDNIAEIFLSASDIPTLCEKIKTEFPDAVIKDNFVTYETDSLYITIDLQNDTMFMQAIITIYESEHPAYQLSIKKALGEQP